MKKQHSQMIKLAAILSFSLMVPSFVVSQTVDSFFVAGIHPKASLQSSNTGKQIMCLFPWKGKLYSGYGDYGANTGPIDIYSYSPDSSKFTYEAQANTEAIYNYRAINGMLYAPAIDRKSYAIPGDYIRLDSSGFWYNYNLGSNSTHLYDAARLNDTVIYMVGSQDEKAAVWKSSNNGLSWKVILRDTAISGRVDDFARFYFGGMYHGNLYVQARDYYGSLHPNSKVYNGVSWSNGPSLFPSSGSLGWKPEEFAGKLLLRSWEPGGSTLLISFDGTSGKSTGLYVMDCFVQGNYYYALVDAGFGVKNLRCTTDLISWENLLVVPANSRSLALLNDILFIGTTDSKILQYSKPVSLLTASVSILQDEFPISFYPNPVNDFIQLDFHGFEDHFEVEIINIEGEIVYQIKNESKFDVSGLPNGIYFLRIKQGNHFIVKKLLKQ
ncbi:MAG: T9SS type A sorting domain-containing protein [Saprospiraceae bacterium]|nr:T9SS type A sorting domain-containing protein [Saprospiraceae bacterium]